MSMRCPETQCQRVPCDVCLSVFFFFLESASFFHMWFLEACINKWVLFWSAAVRTGECQRGGDPTALRCMTPGTGSTSWGLLPLSIISPMSRCHMQVSAFWETLYLHRVSADPAVQEIYWFLDWMLGCIKLCDRWFSARDVGWDSLFIKTSASIKHLKTPIKWLEVQSFANEKQLERRLHFPRGPVNFLVNFSRLPIDARQR